MTLRWSSIAGALLAAALVLSTSPQGYPVRQPLAFDHARHQEEGLACSDCHPRAETTPYAGLPPIRQCLLCHAEPQGEHADEPRIREYAARGEEIPWVQVNRLAGHVYFSHAVHVRLARMDCGECHGDMARQDRPVAASQVDQLTMERCLTCHDDRRASNDCLACHK